MPSCHHLGMLEHATPLPQLATMATMATIWPPAGHHPTTRTRARTRTIASYTNSSHQALSTTIRRRSDFRQAVVFPERRCAGAGGVGPGEYCWRLASLQRSGKRYAHTHTYTHTHTRVCINITNMMLQTRFHLHVTTTLSAPTQHSGVVVGGEPRQVLSEERLGGNLRTAQRSCCSGSTPLRHTTHITYFSERFLSQ
jgi:hypothetical protein